MVSGRFTECSAQAFFQHGWQAIVAGRQAGRILCPMSDDYFLL